MLNAKIFAFFGENALMDCKSVMRRCYACNNRHPKNMLTIPYCTFLLNLFFITLLLNLIINGRFSFNLHIFNNNQHIIKEKPKFLTNPNLPFDKYKPKTTPNQ